MSKTVVADTPVMKQFLDIKSKYNDTITFRMGDFYETFLDDAVVTSQGCIVLTKRANGKATDVNAGFPHHLDNYLPKLVKADIV